MTEKPDAAARNQALREKIAQLPDIGKAMAELMEAFRTPPPSPAAVVLSGQHETEDGR